MADNTQINSPTTSGDVIATDDVSGVKHQLVKVEFGVDGAATRVTAAAPLPVDASGSPTLPLPTGAATSGNQATEITALAQLHTDLIAPTPAGSNVIGHVITDTGSTTAVTGNVAITAASLPLPTGAALETGGNLATIVTNTNKIPSLGQTTASASVPVTAASDGISQTLTGQASLTNTVNNILPSGTAGTTGLDVSKFRSFTVQINSTGTGGNYVFEASNDNSNWVVFPVYNGFSTAPAPTVTNITASNANIMFHGAIMFPFLRCRINATITGGSIQAITFLSDKPLATSQTVVTQGSGANLTANVNTLTTITQVLASAAAADGKANPTMGAWQSIPYQFNGTTWDREYANWNTTTGDTGAKVAAGNGATQTNFNARGATITLLLGTVTGTFTTFQTQLQWSPDVGTTWINYGPAQTNLTTPASGNTFTFIVYPTNTSQAAGATPANLTIGSTQQIVLNAVLPRTWRFTWNIVGSSPSITFTAVYVNYQL
jgi:hypothetical protein